MMCISAEDVAVRLSELLSEELGQEIVPTENADGDCDLEIATSGLLLTINVHDGVIVIRNISVNEGPKGTGAGVVLAVHACADEYGIPVTAYKVLPTAIGFWDRMGYEASTDPENYVRSPA